MKHVDRSVLLPACPTTENVPNMTETERQKVSALCESIKQEVNAEPYKFQTEVDKRKYDSGSKDSGYMDESIKLIYVQEPKFIKDIKTFCKSYKKKKGKEYFDEEMLVRGRLSMKKEKTKAKNDALYLLLDVSGSMWHYEYKGIPLIQLMASYMPLFAQRFDGFWVQTDGARMVISQLKELKKLKKKDSLIRLTGGSGADYIVAIDTIVQHSIKNFGEADPTIVLFSDMHEDFPNPMPRNLALVIPSNKQEFLGEIKDPIFPNEKKNQKIILIDID